MVNPSPSTPICCPKEGQTRGKQNYLPPPFGQCPKERRFILDGFPDGNYGTNEQAATDENDATNEHEAFGDYDETGEDDATDENNIANG